MKFTLRLALSPPTPRGGYHLSFDKVSDAIVLSSKAHCTRNKEVTVSPSIYP